MAKTGFHSAGKAPTPPSKKSTNPPAGKFIAPPNATPKQQAATDQRNKDQAILDEAKAFYDKRAAAAAPPPPPANRMIAPPNASDSQKRKVDEYNKGKELEERVAKSIQPMKDKMDAAAKAAAPPPPPANRMVAPPNATDAQKRKVDEYNKNRDQEDRVAGYIKDAQAKKAAQGGGLGTAAAGVGSTIKRNLLTKKSGIRGLIAVILLLFAIAGFIFSIPLKLLHIANVLQNHNFKVGDHISHYANQKILMRIFGANLDKEGGNRSATGKYLKDKFTNMRIDKFKAALAKDGITMEFDSKNRFVGLSKDGKRFGAEMKDKSFWQRRQAVGGIVTENLNTGGYLKNVLYTKAMRLHAGVSFKFWAKEKAGNLKEKLVSKVRSGVAGDSGLDGGKVGPEERNGPGDDPKDKAGYDSSKNAAQQMGEVATAQADEFAKTKDIKLAHKAGLSKFRVQALKTVGFTGIAIFYCLIQGMVDDALQSGYMERTTFLIREGNMILTMRDQMKTGGFLMSEFGPMMARFSGDYKADPAKSEDAKDFSQAAAWREATGQRVNTNSSPNNYANHNPGLSEAANPNSKILSGIVGNIAELFQFPGSHGVCTVLNSWFGWVLQGVEVTFALLEGEASTIAAEAIKGALIVAASELLIPRILDAATSLAVTGTENAVGLINNGSAGLDLSAKNWGRVQGDKAANDKAVQPIVDAVSLEESAIAKEKGWTYRTFALENTNSIASRLVATAPTSPASLIASLRSSLTSLPRNFAAVLFQPRMAAAATYTNTNQFRAYITTDQEIDNIDPLEAENVLYEKAPNGKTRLEMLGDPSTYTPANGEDANKEDLLHCFVNTYRSPQPADADEICLDLGILTKQDKEDPQNPGQHEIIDKIYCDVHDACGLSYNHTLNVYCDTNIDKVCGTTVQNDFDIYRLYLKYVLNTRAIEGITDDKDPFEQTETPVDPNATAGPPVAGDAKSLAAALLASPNITFGTSWDAATNRMRPDLVKLDLEKTARGEKIKNADSCNDSVSIHPALLNALYEASLKYKIMVDGFVTTHGGSCSSTRYHPQGRAMDIWEINGKRATSSNPGIDKEFSEYIANYIPRGGEILQAQKCFPVNVGLLQRKGISYGYDTCDHIHVSVGGTVK